MELRWRLCHLLHDEITIHSDIIGVSGNRASCFTQDALSLTEDFGNPLRLRRPLEHGVRVLVAHCASLGKGRDLDIGPEGPLVPSFELFARMMDEPRYEGLLFGEISAVTQINRFGNALQSLLLRDDWHQRLLNGSDYPLPGILPLFSLQQLQRNGFIGKGQMNILSQIRNYNPLLFDFVLKRTLRSGGRSFGASPFHTRDFFDRGQQASGLHLL